MSYVQPTGGVVLCHNGFLQNFSSFTQDQDLKRLQVENAVALRSAGATATIQSDVSGRVFTSDGFSCSNLNIGPHLATGGAYGGYEIQLTGTENKLAARQSLATGLAGPEYILAPTVINPTSFQGTTGTVVTIPSTSAPGTLLGSLTITPNVTSYSWCTATVEFSNNTANDTNISVYVVINGTTGSATNLTLSKKSGSLPTYANITVHQRTDVTTAADVAIQGLVYAQQSVANAAEASHLDMFAITNLG